jgi:hypothetical protein
VWTCYIISMPSGGLVANHNRNQYITSTLGWRKFTVNTPPAYMQAPHEPMHLPWTNACKPLENRAAVTLLAYTGQTGHHHRSDRCPTCTQDQHSHRSDRWPRPVRPVTNRAQKWLETTWKPSKCIQQAISRSNFSPLLAMHESSQKCKTFNLELLK